MINSNNLFALISGLELSPYQVKLAQNEYEEYYRLDLDSHIEIKHLKAEIKKRTEFIDKLEKELCEQGKKIISLETLCAEVLGEQPKKWRDRFKNVINRQATF